jgi:hypothetical protein
MTVREAIQAFLGVVLALAATTKLTRPRAAAAALASFGLARPDGRRVALVALVGGEGGLAAWLLTGGATACYAAAGAFLGFALAVGLALRAGAAGAPCPCLGGRSRLGPDLLRGDLALAALAAAAPSVPSLLAVVVVLGSVATLVGSVVGAAAGRRPRARGALEIASEGPPLGSRPAVVDAGGKPLALAVFVSDGCPPCAAVAGSVRALAEHAAVAVRTFDERADAEVWRALAVPGAPYAVALDATGAVRAKGTFNTGAQLESILATAERRVAAPARGASRRGFLTRAGQVVLGASGAGMLAAVLAPGEAEGYHFCGHTFTTGSCPHPTGLPRVDRHNRPLRAADGRPVDDLGRLVDAQGRPVDESGRPLMDPDGLPLPTAPRSQLCLETVRKRYGFRTWIDGSWHRCCNGHVRKLSDCCAFRSRRINGDGALTGYCANGRTVFCVFYYQTGVPC